MSSYFPIPSNFSISNENNLFVKSAVKVFNFPNNASLKSLNGLYKKKDIYFSLYFLENFEWVKIFDKKCEFEECCEFKRENLDINNSTALIIPAKNKLNPDRTNILPKPYSLRLDKSPINERAEYTFSINKISTSYQGEFPYELANPGKSFFSTDILRTDFDNDSKTFFLLMNLNKSAKDKREHELNIFTAKKQKLIHKYLVKTNSFDSYLLPKYNSLKNNDNLFLSCKTTSFIPIFITIKFNKEILEISAEHTHPPHELFLGAERFKILSSLKNNWILE
tara:strand:+ start:489 stop:1328 length:840 start_codon:yes stop_codon:yes gene_type:complete